MLNTDMKPTTLIAEDDACNYRLLNAVLRNDYNLLWAKDGQEAVEMALCNEEIDIVLMDNKMPRMNGVDALKMIKERRPGLPVVMQTAYAFDADRNAALNYGADGYVTKPIRCVALLDLMKKILRNKAEI